MRGRGLVLGALGASLLLAAPAAAQDLGASKNVQHLKTITEAKDATAINFLEYKQGGHVGAARRWTSCSSPAASG